MAADPPLIVHVIHRLGVGGLENGLVNLINHLPEEKFRHAIVCLTEATDFRHRIRRDDVAIYEMHRREGQDLGLYRRLYHLFRRLRPAIVHTRNLATLECQLPAFLAGVPVRIHGEHGWDVFDPEGNSRKYQWLRRAFRPLVHRYIPLSRQLEEYLIERIGVPREKVTRICNGVDTTVFHPPTEGREPIPGCPFTGPELVLIGTVGRMHGVKDQTTLARAFIEMLQGNPDLKRRARLVMVGDGPLRTECESLLAQAGVGDLAWLPGERDDIPRILRGLDVFVLPSRAEGISNTILEAMATGLPVVATRVGGNPELVTEGVTGTLVPPGDWGAMATSLIPYLEDGSLRQRQGNEALARCREQYSIETMVQRYQALYEHQLTSIQQGRN
ncbi:hypothetical protein MIT9_P1734 [Methylomarinovum caldicuralii]|uniref:Glycosyltransferase subfamily 4-like N-terminal domain-containing protein n=1 Tax=Methylomarinovum caldicuralii TaxID=438856 RepID=A0AAU9C4T3_9GAMM|nr:TIGR03088 family PEP-CTERM/XrtA system glycosyltransferase [Methylomarinovum caldicuralii]BCX82149.1 hypothetical protein MIT9_P1734 [Methylomarinovum caldicuralii]